MRALILSLMMVVAYAASNTGVVIWASKHAKSTANNAMQNNQGGRYFGGAIRLPFTLLMGSNIELGISNLPDQFWKDDLDELKITDRHDYVINSLYMLSDSMAVILGVDYFKQGLSPDFQERFSNHFNYHAGIEWTMPVVEHLDSGLRVLYNFNKSHDYCYGANCSTPFKIDQSQLELQMVAIASL